jgi:uncharacterized protein YndB with AHSA1/START domain
MARRPLLTEWLLPVVELKLEPGAAFTFKTQPYPGWDDIVNCRILEIEAQRKLSYTWGVAWPVPACRRLPLPVQLDHVLVVHRVAGAHLLAVELDTLPPDPGELQLRRPPAVHLLRHVADGAAAAQGEGPAAVRGVARHLGVDAYDAEQVEERGADRGEAPPALGGDGEGDERVGGQLAEDGQLGLGIGEAVGLVGEEESGQARSERVEGGLRSPPRRR